MFGMYTVQRLLVANARYIYIYIYICRGCPLTVLFGPKRTKVFKMLPSQIVHEHSAKPIHGCNMFDRMVFRSSPCCPRPDAMNHDYMILLRAFFFCSKYSFSAFSQESMPSQISFRDSSLFSAQQISTIKLDCEAWQNRLSRIR
jgi:hypothetical protein